MTKGSTGTCTPAYLCTARVGYDGPTGLGSPNGIGAFKLLAEPAPTVSSVTLGGTPSDPIVTVGGSNLGALAPPGSPEWDCSASYSGDVFGGVGLNFGDTTAGWTAGQGGDCLGLIVSSWSSSSATLSFGSFYQGVTAMHAGDSYTFELQAHLFSGTLG